LFALFKILLIFTAVVLLIRIKAPLGLALILGAVGVALGFSMTPFETVQALGGMAVSASTLEFVGLVGLVLTLSLTLKTGGQIERITANLRGFFPRRRFLVAALPSIVGLLPMPGGALFSAPMVEAGCGGADVSGNDKVTVNHWFRHVWEYTWPLYPGLILASDFAGIAVGTLSLLQAPLTAASLAFGAVFLLRRIPGGDIAEQPSGAGRHRGAGLFLFEMFPFLVVVLLHILFGIPLLAALCVGIAWTVSVNLLRRTARPAAFLKAVFGNLHFYGFLVMAFGVKFFGGMMQACGALDELGAFFTVSGIPVLLVVVLLPFLTGLISGITIVYVSAAFPVLLAVPAVASDPLPYLVLAFCSGFIGTLISPIHACLVLTSAYFHERLWRNIAGMALPALAVLGAGLLLHWAYRAWL